MTMPPVPAARPLVPRIDRPEAYIDANEIEVMAARLPLRGARILELGCGRAFTTRRLATEFAPAVIVACEVDRIQHEKNRLMDDLPNVQFVFGGAEAIEQPDASFDVVILLKSLHHVPLGKMDAAMQEIARVLRPGGLAYISEPVYRGDFNDILRLFNDERVVRQAAFDAVRGAVERGALELLEQVFFHAATRFADFAEFEARILQATHTNHPLGEPLYRQVKAKFEAHLGPDGALFQNPQRVDLLRRPGGHPGTGKREAIS